MILGRKKPSFQWFPKNVRFWSKTQTKNAKSFRIEHCTKQLPRIFQFFYHQNSKFIFLRKMASKSTFVEMSKKRSKSKRVRGIYQKQVYRSSSYLYFLQCNGIKKKQMKGDVAFWNAIFGMTYCRMSKTNDVLWILRQNWKR